MMWVVWEASTRLGAKSGTGVLRRYRRSGARLCWRTPSTQCQRCRRSVESRVRRVGPSVGLSAACCSLDEAPTMDTKVIGQDPPATVARCRIHNLVSIGLSRESLSMCVERQPRLRKPHTPHRRPQCGLAIDSPWRSDRTPAGTGRLIHSWPSGLEAIHANFGERQSRGVDSRSRLPALIGTLP